MRIAKRETRNAKRGLRSGDLGAGSGENCELRNADCEMRNAECAAARELSVIRYWLFVSNARRLANADTFIAAAMIAARIFPSCR